MITENKNLSITDVSRIKAEFLMELLGVRDFSLIIDHLIREEWERRHGPITFAQVPELRDRAVAALGQSSPPKEEEAQSSPKQKKKAA